MKYHPKNDPSVEAGEKFIDIARAYEMLILDKGGKQKKMMEQKQLEQSSLMF
jgi:DnaJ-class molecular chaperone